IIKNQIKETPFIKSGNKRVYWVNKNSKYFPKNISDIKLDRTFFKGRNIKNIYNEIESSIITSRGCIYNCAFCGGASSLNRDIYAREKNKESIIREIKEIVSLDSKVNSIRVLDDLFLRDRNNMNKAIDIFNEFNNLTWRGMAHIKSFKNCEDIYLKLKESGCKELFIGIESGSPRIRKDINKIGKTSEIKSVICKLLSVGINVKGYFIYGFPEEQIDDLKKTYSLARELKLKSLELDGDFRVSVFQFRPYHGTELYYRILKTKKNIPNCKLNLDISGIDGRMQFNYQSGNYSNCTQEEVDNYIIKTLELNDGEKYVRKNKAMQKL
ncbi:B12-binding domain-containing radical SAM protein, partial [Clostridium chrysemydis]|uniref:B12-binding domain-containing radical SAM protein n=1 Tax=Clostridium chrysemydis TaxID=2665504 RepID=UPI003F343F37